MGSNMSQELAGGLLNISLEQAIAIQLRDNHYPPVPLSMVKPCIDAISAVNDEAFEKLIELPEGILWKGQSTAPASAIVESHHLYAWCNYEDND
jgi:hypothetical protein